MRRNKGVVYTGLLAAVVAASSLAGCSGKGEEKGQNTPPPAPKDTSQSTSSETPETKPITLNWLTYQYGPVDENAESKKLLEEKFNVKFNIWYLDVTKREELLGTKMAGGEFPDFMTVYNGADLAKFIDQEIAVTYTEEELNQYMPNYKALVDKYNPESWTYAKRNGEYMGIPSLNTDGVYGWAVAWRKDWLDKVGITKVPETLDELIEAMRKFRNDDPDGNGKKDTYGMSKTGMQQVYGAFGIYPEYWTERDGQIVWSGITPEAKKALEVLRQMKKDDLISPEWVLPDGENQGGYWAISHDFVNGKIGLSSHGAYYHWAPADQAKNFPGGDNTKMLAETNPNAVIAYGKPVKGPDGKAGVPAPGMTGSTYMAFGQGAKDPEVKHRIMQIWDTVYSDYDLFMKVKFGTLDQTYVMNGLMPKMKDEYSKNEDQAKLGLHITFSPFANPDFIAKWQDPEEQAKTKELFLYPEGSISNAVKAPLPSESKYYNNLVKFQQDTFTAIINGDKPLDEFDKFVEQWKQDGGDQLTKEANEWLQSLK
ncbi:ABC transporter substrate-binding protein [Paenibacillus sp. GCM10027626]|uniref:ABC transporter substrate-binding protein n=1 Tax=Paenibacillus sp. GCM10027626 TaxID=3273411 RepID=UPI0036389BFF